MFIFMPPGIMMSPGFWSALQAPSHFASIVVVVSRGAGRAAFAVRGRLHRVGGIEIAGDLGMRGDRHAGDAADGIADIAGRGLLDVLLGADSFAIGENIVLICLSVVSSVQCCIVISGTGEPGAQHLHFPQAGLAHRQFHRARHRCAGSNASRPSAEAK
jgi:hypothetical protein